MEYAGADSAVTTSTAPAEANARPQPAYQLFMLALCAVALVFLLLQSATRLDPETRRILDWADTAICFLFFLDFIYQLTKATDRLAYMRTWGWIDLLSSIPVISVLRLGRLARVARILRLLRGVRAARLLLQMAAYQKTQSAFLAALLIALLLVTCSSIAVLQLEKVKEANILSAGDAVWWAITTMSTVGYGDYYPVTTGGRVVAVILMAGGVGVFGTFSALMAAWFLSAHSESK